MIEKRIACVEHARSLIGTPFIWGGRQPQDHGLDSVGLVAAALSHVGALPPAALRASFTEAGGPLERAAAYFRSLYTPQRLWDELPATDLPRIGDLAVYGANARSVAGVALCVGDGRVICACGGGPWCTSVEIARARGAAVVLQESPHFRGDLLGYRRSPFAGD